MSGSLLDEETMLPLLGGRLGRPYLYEPACTSTQDLLRGSGLSEGAVAVTEHQTAGRGRSGRRWEDEPGASILVSVLLRPPTRNRRRSAELSLVAALAVADALETVTGLAAQVKWPNDVLITGHKVAGILLEADGGAVIVGIGINVNQSQDALPGQTRLPPASLRTVTGLPHERAPLLASLLARLEARDGEWRTSGLDPIAAALEDRNWLRGLRVETEGRAGVAGPIRPDGRLEVHLDVGEVVPVGSGEVVLLPCNDQLQG